MRKAYKRKFGDDANVPEMIRKGMSKELEEKLADQELVTRKSTRVTYWEGLVDATGTFGETGVRGRGYVEMTGYTNSNR